MSYTIEKLPGEPIIIVTTHPDFDAEAEYPLVRKEVAELLSRQPAPVFYIMDYTHLSAGLDEIMIVASGRTRQPDANLRHPNVWQAIVVTNQDILRMAARGVSGEVFGGFDVPTFDTLDEALAYARAQY